LSVAEFFLVPSRRPEIGVPRNEPIDQMSSFETRASLAARDAVNIPETKQWLPKK